VGLAHTGSAAANKRKPTIDYPRIETGSDTMLRFVGGEKSWRLPPLNIIQAYLT
jgi:hypothetical protein